MSKSVGYLWAVIDIPSYFKEKYTVYGRHFACKMLASTDMVMTNTKGLALQSLSPSLKVWRRRKTTHWVLGH